MGITPDSSLTVEITLTSAQRKNIATAMGLSGEASNDLVQAWADQCLAEALVRVAISATTSEEHISTHEAAEILDVSESRVRQRLRDGTLHGLKEGKSWRVYVAAVEKEREAADKRAGHTEVAQCSLSPDHMSFAFPRDMCVLHDGQTSASGKITRFSRIDVFVISGFDNTTLQPIPGQRRFVEWFQFLPSTEEATHNLRGEATLSGNAVLTRHMRGSEALEEYKRLTKETIR